MKKSCINLARVSFLTITLFAVSNVYALFDAQLLVGHSSTTTKDSEDSSYYKYTLAAHVSPFPIVSLGLALDKEDMKASDLEKLSLETASSFVVSVDIMATVPFVPIVTPYARLTIPVYAAGEVKSKDGAVSVQSETGGQVLAFGAMYNVVPMVDVLFELATGVKMKNLDEVTVSGVKATLSDSQKTKKATKTFDIRLGVSVGI